MSRKVIPSTRSVAVVGAVSPTLGTLLAGAGSEGSAPTRPHGGREALRPATVADAEALGAADDLGAVAPGMLAVSILEADAVADIENTRRVGRSSRMDGCTQFPTGCVDRGGKG